jgi:hypothetical protein
MLAVAYLDGENPSLIVQRGTYDLIKTAALDKDLETIWSRELRNPHELAGPGTHGLIAADVDGDGRDELILGATALDDDGSVLWESGLGHPDVATWPTSTRTIRAWRCFSASSPAGTAAAWRSCRRGTGASFGTTKARRGTSTGRG